MAELRYNINSDTLGAWTAVTPISSALYDYKRERPSVYPSVSLKDDIVFKGADFVLIEALPLYEKVSFKAERRCAGSWSDYWYGFFYRRDCQVDYDICTITIQPKPDESYTYFTEQYSGRQNFYYVPAVSVKPIKAIYEVECCQETSFTGVPPPPTITCPGLVNPADWAPVPVYVDFVVNPLNALEITRTVCWHRILAYGTCIGSVAYPPDGPGWTILSAGNMCPSYSRWQGDPLYATVISELKYGRSLNAVLLALVAICDSVDGLVSDFFGINPDGTAPANSEYAFATENLKKLTLHQKSDVKRPFNSNSALSISYEISLKELLSDLQVLFNIAWTIDENNKLRVEHLSYFVDGLGSWSITAGNMKKQLVPDNSELPHRELFQYMDEMSSDYFRAFPIVYASGKDDKTYKCTMISTDLGFIQNTDNLDAISDSGFVLVSTYLIADQRYIKDFNRPLSFQELHDALHRHGRVFEDALEFNGAGATTFAHWEKNLKQPAFTIAVGCDEVPNINQEAVTTMGNADIHSITHDVANSCISINLKY